MSRNSGKGDSQRLVRALNLSDWIFGQTSEVQDAAEGGPTDHPLRKQRMKGDQRMRAMVVTFHNGGGVYRRSYWRGVSPSLSHGDGGLGNCAE